MFLRLSTRREAATSTRDAPSPSPPAATSTLHSRRKPPATGRLVFVCSGQRVSNPTRLCHSDRSENLVVRDSGGVGATPREHDRNEILRCAQNDKGERALHVPTLVLPHLR